MEHKIGDQFRVDGLLLEVKESYECDGCYFNEKGRHCWDKGFEGPCSGSERSDRKSVIFALVGDGRKEESKRSNNGDDVKITILSDIRPKDTFVHGYERRTLIEYNGKKFKVKYLNSSSIPCGFDSDHSISVLSTSDLLWHSIADYKEIYPEIRKNNHDFMDMQVDEADVFTEKCVNYIKLIY